MEKPPVSKISEYTVFIYESGIYEDADSDKASDYGVYEAGSASEAWDKCMAEHFGNPYEVFGYVVCPDSLVENFDGCDP